MAHLSVEKKGKREDARARARACESAPQHVPQLLAQPSDYARESSHMLKRKPTRIELKPEDREEYFAHKKETAKPDAESSKPTDKDVRIGLAKAR